MHRSDLLCFSRDLETWTSRYLLSLGRILGVAPVREKSLRHRDLSALSKNDQRADSTAKHYLSLAQQFKRRHLRIAIYLIFLHHNVTSFCLATSLRYYSSCLILNTDYARN